MSEQLTELNNTIHGKKLIYLKEDITFRELDILKQTYQYEKLNNAIEGLKTIIHELRKNKTMSEQSNDKFYYGNKWFGTTARNEKKRILKREIESNILKKITDSIL